MYSQVISLVGVLYMLVVLVSAATADDATAYEVLESYGFPEGLLPRIVDDYTIDSSDGKFSLHLESTCKVDIPDAYPVRYSSRISGSISNDRIRDLSGISVRVLFIWWNIDTISVSGSDLSFQVGPFSASFPAANFIENPYCLGRVEEKPYFL